MRSNETFPVIVEVIASNMMYSCSLEQSVRNSTDQDEKTYLNISITVIVENTFDALSSCFIIKV